MTGSGFARWRWLHLAASGIVCLLAILHSALTPFLYTQWTADAVWFLGAGLGLLLLGILNLTHVGIEPRRRPSARLVGWSNWVFLSFGLGALLAVSAPQAYAVVAGLAGQALAGLWTLSGPSDAD